MALPPLPEIFGNYALRGFEEIQAPDAISWLPSAPGWRVLLVVALVAACWKGWQYGKYWWRNRYRRFAIAELHSILSSDLDPASKLGRVSTLLKATALQAYDRRSIAGLNGGDWIKWLNSLVPGPLFDAEQQQLLTVEAYRAEPQLNEQDLQQLGGLVEQWIGSHREPAHD